MRIPANAHATVSHGQNSHTHICMTYDGSIHMYICQTHPEQTNTKKYILMY